MESINVIELTLPFLSPYDALSALSACTLYHTIFKKKIQRSWEDAHEEAFMASFYHKRNHPDYAIMLLEAAAKYGFSQLTKSLLERGHCSRIILRNACMCRDPDLPVYLRKQYNAKFLDTDLEAASMKGRLQVVRLLHEQYGVELSSHSLAVAIVNRHYHVAHYLCVKGVTLHKTNPISWQCFADSKDIKLMELAISHSYTCPDWMIDIALNKGCQIEKVLGSDRLPTPKRMALMCKKGDLELIQTLCECGAKFEGEVADNICLSGNVEAVRYMFSKGFKPSDDVTDYVAQNGLLDVLRFLHEQGYAISTRAMLSACGDIGSLDVVKFICACNIPIMPYAVDTAFKCDRFDICRFLISQGGNFSTRLIKAAATHGVTDPFTLLSEFKRPLPKFALDLAKTHERQELVEYLSLPETLWAAQEQGGGYQCAIM